MIYSVGDVVTYSAFGDTQRRVHVESKHANIKNGRAGFDGLVVDGPDAGMSVWGYDYQILSVLTPLMRWPDTSHD